MDYKLKLIRLSPTSECTPGDLYLNDTHFCKTLEDIDRGLDNAMDLGTLKLIKKAGITAIPTGTYAVIINHSNHFNKEMPLLLKVKDFEGVRIHSGNVVGDSEGCILVGESYATNTLSMSRIAWNRLMDQLKDYTSITLTIIRSNDNT